ncbi:MAG: metallophosphoesterase [Leptospiraceae bacterium]|nr:metallophosphoesterase [Leptospiraceae bacterium]
MSEIEYICLSDLHLGAYNSLLTYTDKDAHTDPSKSSQGLLHLVKVLEKIITLVNKKKKARIILNGDIFELALANTNEAAMSFDVFLQSLFDSNKKQTFSDKFIYIPGNHDHHLWETARERQFLEYMEKIPPGKLINIPWHHTKMIKPTPLKSRFITTLIRRHKNLNKGRALVVYPNLCLVDRKTEKYVVITHGHFIESIYRLMSRLQSILLPGKTLPDTIDKIERENFAWIDFFWSVLGRSGGVGESIGIMYDMLQDQNSLEELANNLFTHLMKGGKIPPAFQSMLKPVLNFITAWFVGYIATHERGLTNELLGNDAKTGLSWYIECPLRLQFLQENKAGLPRNMTFVFGHTHKPFCEKSKAFLASGYPAEIGLMNTGGWVVDTIRPQPQFGGSAVLIDEEKNAVLVRLYNETNHKIRFESVDSSEKNPLLKKILDKVDVTSDVFRDFSEAMQEEIQLKRKVIQKRIE